MPVRRCKLTKRLIFWLIAIALLFTAAAAEVMPTSVLLSESELTLDISREDSSVRLESSLVPEGSGNGIRWYVSDERVVRVEDGLVTPLKVGTAVITVRAKGYNGIKASCTVNVIDSSLPSRIVAYPGKLELEPSRTAQVSCVSLPVGSSAEYEYRTSNPSVATVDENGLVTAVGRGSTKLTVTSRENPAVTVTVPITVEYGKRITDLYFSSDLMTLQKGDVAYCGLVRTPADASSAIMYESSDEDVVCVDQDGLMTALRHGAVMITATSCRNYSITDTFMVVVEDPNYPTEIVYSTDREPLLGVGDEIRFSVSMLPANCDDSYVITSSREDIVSVDGDTVKALKRGMSIVTIRSLYNDKLTAEIPVTVQDGTNVLEMPLRKTDEAGIEANVARIRAIKQCAIDELTRLNEAGVLIKEKEYARRVEIIENAFDMYDFVWTVDEVQKYWSAANSELGNKDFKPGNFYYGLPYTSGTNYNHTYNVTKAIEQERYVPVEGKNYYLLNRNTAYGASYAGNDCSAFVALSLWKHTVYAGDTIKTGTLYYDYRLVHFEDPMELRPGDILVRHSVHVVMFLYWADEDHTQAVFIQQGGSEPGINTVNTVVQDISYYTDDYYRLRRIRNFTED